MDTPDKKELIDGISALLKAHEEPYEPGSWESFSKQKKSKRPVVIAWLSIAAALAIIVTAVPYLLKDKNNDSIILKRKNIPQKKHTQDARKTPFTEASQLTNTKQAVKQHTVNSQRKNLNAPVYNGVELAANSDITTAVEEIKTADAVKTSTVDPINAKLKPVQENDINDFLQKESKIATADKEREPSKWNFGIELLPTLLQNKLNVGAGITTEFKLSKRFSISSGIAYVALDASKNASPEPVGVASFSSNKKLVATDANISGIDIPLSLTYNLNKKVYTSIGVSYFNVLTEKRNNKYITELEVSRTHKDPETGIMETFRAKASEENAELSPESPLKGNSYLGFFNFSIGHKKEIFKNYNIVIEPFLKIPVGKLSNEDLQLSNGGVKLRFTF
jgi:hypothetical protein